MHNQPSIAYFIARLVAPVSVSPPRTNSTQCLLARLACPRPAAHARAAGLRATTPTPFACSLPAPHVPPPCLPSPHPLPHLQMMMFDDVMALGYWRPSFAPPSLSPPFVPTNTPLSHPTAPHSHLIRTHPLPSASALPFRMPRPRGRPARTLPLAPPPRARLSKNASQ